jgi:hypothetical protein
MLVTNINGSDLGSGDVIQPYRGPTPPDHLNHTYIFLLYSQKLVHSENETRALFVDISEIVDHHCLNNPFIVHNPKSEMLNMGTIFNNKWSSRNHLMLYVKYDGQQFH